ncbi:MAG: hypothetical protein H7Y33_02355 [Cytophagales bacterium]|nr:hypothetical protein [Rhizobacter sp.]
MNIAFKKLIPAAAAALLMGSAAWAQEPATSPPPGDAAKSVMPGEAVSLPQVQTSGEVSYVTGGIPYEQIPAFTQARGQYPLNIEVYEKDGAKNSFTADAQVRLIDRKGGVVLDAKTTGPFLWVKVPPGQYRLQTTLNGKTKEQGVAVGSLIYSREQAGFGWVGGKIEQAGTRKRPPTHRGRRLVTKYCRRQHDTETATWRAGPKRQLPSASGEISPPSTPRVFAARGRKATI